MKPNILGLCIGLAIGAAAVSKSQDGIVFMHPVYDIPPTDPNEIGNYIYRGAPAPPLNANGIAITNDWPKRIFITNNPPFLTNVTIQSAENLVFNKTGSNVWDIRFESTWSNTVIHPVLDIGRHVSAITPPPIPSLDFVPTFIHTNVFIMLLPDGKTAVSRSLAHMSLATLSQILATNNNCWLIEIR